MTRSRSLLARPVRHVAWAAWATFAALVLLAAASASLRAQQTVERGFPLSAKGSVKVYNYAGTLRIVGWDRDSVAVSGTADAGARIFGGGGRDGIKLGVEGSASGTPRADLVVRVPATAQVWARGAATDVMVEGVIGSVDVGSVGGDVRVEGAPSALVAETMDGRLEIIGSPGVLRAKTATGSLTWRGSGDGATRASVSGRVSAEGGPLGSARIETVTGDVVVTAALRSDASLVIESHAGSVELRLARDVPVSITADAIEVSGPGIKPQPAVPAPKRAAPRKLEFGKPVAGESAEVTVRSFKGSVRIVRD
jgi:hypothetical protein